MATNAQNTDVNQGLNPPALEASMFAPGKNKKSSKKTQKGAGFGGGLLGEGLPATPTGERSVEAPSLLGTMDIDMGTYENSYPPLPDNNSDLDIDEERASPTPM